MTLYKLHDYQEEGVQYLRARGRAGLFLDMGLGKTATCLAALEERHLPALVLAPKRVAETVWPVEKVKWAPHLRLALAAGEPLHRQAQLERNDVDLVVLGRDNIKDLANARRYRPFKTLIIDELSAYKNPAGAWFKAARALTRQRQLEYVWGLTGTPSPNGYLDLWAQVALLDGGRRLGPNITTYRGRYFLPGRQLPNGVVTRWDPRPETVDEVNALIQDICLSMKAEGRIHLPSRTDNQLRVDLPRKVMDAYKEFEDKLVVDFRELFDGDVHSAGNAATLTGRLSQITAGFMYVDEAELNDYAYTKLHTEKVKAVQEVAEGNGGSPVLVAYRFQAELEMLRAALPKARMIDEPNVIEQWNQGEVPVLLAHPQAAGHGLNLQYGGHTIVWSSPTWSLEEWEQFNGRLHRQGQEHPVVIHTVNAHGTIDSLIVNRVQTKADVQDALMDYLESPI